MVSEHHTPDLSDGADNFYRSERVETRSVKFDTIYGTRVAGNLFIPKDMTEGMSLPAIVVGHPMGAVKEQSANLYAQKMAEQGYAAIAIDLPFWGDSEGARNRVLPDMYVEAFSAAVDYLGLQDFVDRNRIGAIGICGSGSFVIGAAKIDPRIRAVATVSMYDMGQANRNGIGHSVSIEDRKQEIAQAAKQRWDEAAGGEIQYTSGAPHEVTGNAVGDEFFDFYRTERGKVTPTGQTEATTTHPTLSSNTKFMNFYPFEDIATISPRPMLFVTGTEAHSREFSEDAYARAAEPKELFWVEGAGHVDLYDRTGLIPFDKLSAFFGEHLD